MASETGPKRPSPGHTERPTGGGSEQSLERKDFYPVRTGWFESQGVLFVGGVSPDGQHDGSSATEASGDQLAARVGG